MLIGIPKEIKKQEYRVGLVPSGVKQLVADGHKVMVETTAGEEVGFSDADYVQAGATIVSSASEIFEQAQMIVKVKEPQAIEYQQLQPNQILFTYLHLAPDLAQTKGLISSKCIAIAYETVTDKNGGLPLLRPMSEVAGRMSIQAGAYSLTKHQGGSGILLPGVPGVPPAKVLVLGAGVVGLNAARIAMGMGAKVTIMDISLDRLAQIDQMFGPQLVTEYSTHENIVQHLTDTDLLIGAVLLPGAASPKLISQDMLKLMPKGSVIVDVAIDQGGCVETSHPTTHQDPTFIVEGIVHYCVANMPGGVARTSTLALTNATFPFIRQISNQGYQEAFAQNPHLLAGLNVFKGNLTNLAVANALDLPFAAYSEA